MDRFEERLNLILSYINEHKNDPEIQNRLSLYVQGQKKADKLFEFITNLFEYDKKPRVLDAEFDTSKFTVMYRGTKRKSYHAGLFMDDENKHYGTGKHGNGIYCSSYSSVSDFYSKNSEGDVMQLYLINAHVVSESTLKRYVSFLKGESIDISKKNPLVFNFETNTKEEFDSEYSKERLFRLKTLIDSLKDSELRDLFLRTIWRDTSKLAIMLGYDVVNVFSGMSSNVIVLNHNKITLSKAEYDRIYSKDEKLKKRLPLKTSESQSQKEN